MAPLVSICIPTYLQADLFERCLQSVIAQDFKNIEVIVSDDSPGDSVKIIVEKYSDQLKVRYSHNNPSLGTPANWNHALNMGNGDYLMLLHHDDWLANNYTLSRFINHSLANPNASVLFGKIMDTSKMQKGIYDKFSDQYFKLYFKEPIQLLIKNVIGPPSNLIIRREVSIRYNTDYKWLVDIEFYIHLLIAGYKFSFVDERLFCVGWHEGQMTNFIQKNTDILVKENILFAQEYLTFIKDNLKVYDHLWRLLRNQNIRSVEDLLATGLAAGQVPDFILKMIQAQAKLSPALLKYGLVSKSMMLISYLSR